MAIPSRRQVQLLEGAYAYVLEHGLAEVSLRPLAAAIGSSPRVLMFLFGNKDGLVKALLARARRDELALLHDLTAERTPVGLGASVARIWTWLCAEQHRALLRLWVEAYSRSLIDPDGPWAGFAQATVTDWLDVLAASQEPAEADAEARRTLALAVLRGALLDLLATGDEARTTEAVRAFSNGLEEA